MAYSLAIAMPYRYLLPPTRLWHALRLCLLVLCWLPMAAMARDYVSARAYWTDTTASASLEQAQAQRFTPFQNILSKGFSTSVQWIRLTIAPADAASGDQLVLRLRPVFLDEIALFDPADPNSHPQPRLTGDWTPPQASEFESIHHTFVIPAQSVPRYVWLRLRSTSSQLLQVEAMPVREMQRSDQRLGLVYCALLALILAFLAWVFLAWLRDRDPLLGTFVLRQSVLLIYTACYLGYHRLLLADVVAPQTQDALYSWMVFFTTALSVVFEYRFLREYALARWAHACFWALQIISALLMVAMLFGQTRIALMVNAAVIASSLVLFLVVSMLLRPMSVHQQAPAAYQLPPSVVQAYYLVIFLLLALSVLPSLGLLTATGLALYGVLLYGVASGGLMTSLLIVRAEKLDQLRHEVSNSLAISRAQLATEKQRRHDQTQLLSMLMHELKTPLSIIDLAVTTRSNDERTAGYVTRAVDNIKAILDRCIQTDRMVEREFTLKPQPMDLAAQLQQCLDGRKEGVTRFALQVTGACPVTSDLQCVGIIINNVLDNAIKHGDPLAPVALQLAPRTHADGRAGFQLTLANRPGMSGWPDPHNVFSKYYRSSAAQKVSGTGLGLYLAHNLAALLRGELRYAPDDHTIRFELWIPT